ncbi:MAG: flagellar biosynthesis regulator FlaF [Streptococcus salivarius]
MKETEGKGFDTERDAAQTALDELKKAQESGNLDDMKAKLEALNEKAKLWQLNSTNKQQRHNKLKQEQKAHNSR